MTFHLGGGRHRGPSRFSYAPYWPSSHAIARQAEDHDAPYDPNARKVDMFVVAAGVVALVGVGALVAATMRRY
jgi:hypothetical protein